MNIDDATRDELRHAIDRIDRRDALNALKWHYELRCEPDDNTHDAYETFNKAVEAGALALHRGQADSFTIQEVWTR